MSNLTVRREELVSLLSPGFENMLDHFQTRHGLVALKVYKATDEYLEPRQVAGFAEGSALIYDLTKDERFKTFAIQCLRDLRRLGLHTHGIWHFEGGHPDAMEGRIWTPAYYASTLAEDRETLEWLGEVARSWPYDEKKHWHFAHVGLWSGVDIADNHPYNQLASMASPCWLIGNAIRDQVLMERGANFMNHVLIAGQRPQGDWSYDLEGFFNSVEDVYTRQNVQEVVRLLAHEPWRSDRRFQMMLIKALGYIERTSAHGDGDYTLRTHWREPGTRGGDGFSVAFNQWYLVKYAPEAAHLRPLAAKALRFFLNKVERPMKVYHARYWQGERYIHGEMGFDGRAAMLLHLLRDWVTL